jgi:hypothetical protein
MIYPKDKILTFKNDKVQENLKLLHETYGTFFFMFFNNIKLPVKLYVKTEKYNPTFKYYILQLDNKNRTSSFHTFQIIFVDVEKTKLNNNCYISNIHKHTEYSGTDIINFVLKFLKSIYTHKIHIHDSTTVNKNGYIVDLSLFKLIEKGQTFYQKFGFKFDLPENEWHSRIILFGNKQNLYKAIPDILNNFKKIKIKCVVKAYKEVLKLLLNVIDDNNYNKLQIYLFEEDNNKYIVDSANNKSMCVQIIRDFSIIIGMFEGYDHFTYLYEYMIFLFHKHFELYNVFIKSFIKNIIYKITYIDYSVLFKHVEIVYYLYMIRHGSLSMTFTY